MFEIYAIIDEILEEKAATSIIAESQNWNIWTWQFKNEGCLENSFGETIKKPWKKSPNLKCFKLANHN